MRGKATVLADAKRLGDMIASGRAVLPELALRCVQAAMNGDIGPGDASDIYETYMLAATRGRRLVNHSDKGTKANVSKLRQVIRLGECKNVQPLKLLTLVLKLHYDHCLDNRLKPAYAAMVDVARAQLKSAKPLSQRQIVALISA